MAEPESPLFLSPCSSSSTIVPGGNYTLTSQLGPPRLSEIKILMPDYVETKMVKMDDLEEFVGQESSASGPLTILHLLIYVFSKNWTADMTFVSDIKLIHMGKQYRISRLTDVHSDYPTLESVASRFPTFQLLVSANQIMPPVSLAVPHLIAQTFQPKQPEDDVPVTYAEAMLKMIKQARKRASSRSSSSTNTTAFGSTRSSGDASVTSSSNEGTKRRKRTKVKESWKKVFSRVSVRAH